MERLLEIRFNGDVWAQLTFNYKGINRGEVLIQNFQPQPIQISGGVRYDLILTASNSKPFRHATMGTVADIKHHDINFIIQEFNQNITQSNILDYNIHYPIPLNFDFHIVASNEIIGTVRIETDFDENEKELYFTSSVANVADNNIPANSMVTNVDLLQQFFTTHLTMFDPQYLGWLP